MNIFACVMRLCVEICDVIIIINLHHLIPGQNFLHFPKNHCFAQKHSNPNKNWQNHQTIFSWAFLFSLFTWYFTI